MEVLNILIGFVSFLYNFVITTDLKPLKSNINAFAETDSTDNVSSTEDSSNLLLRAVGRTIYLDNAELWQSISILDTYKSF